VAANKRSDIQIARDRREIADLYVRGWSQGRIADELNRRRQAEWVAAMDAGTTDAPVPYELTRQMVNYDLKAIQSEWKRLSAFDLDEMKGQQLAKLDETERAAWEAWERSSQVHDEVTNQVVDIELKVKTGDEPLRLPGVRKMMKRKRVQLLGDPRYLLVINTCIERRCKLLGLDAPTKTESELNVAVEPTKLYGSINLDLV